MASINPIDLFKGGDAGAAAVLFALGILLGALLACVVCKLRGRCACGNDGECACSGQKKRDDAKFEKRRPAPADGSIEIYVGNLSYDLTEDVLRKTFEAYGTVNSARIITNRYNGKSKGFGFVHMPNRAEADAACEALNDKDLLGRKLKCNEAKNVG